MSTSSPLFIPSLLPFGKDYKVVFEKQQSSKEKESLSKEDLSLLNTLYEKVQEDPKKHIDPLKQLFARCPKVPEIANLLTFALLQTGKRKEAESLIEKTWKEHPDYLIGQINYADQSLRQGKKELVPIIFKGCYDLHALCPERETFHFSEFRGFMVAMGFYHLKLGLKDKAESHYELAFQVDPLHPSVAALEKDLFKPSLIKKLFSFFRVYTAPT